MRMTINKEGTSDVEKIIESILKRNRLLDKSTVKHHYLDILFNLLSNNESDEGKIGKCIDLFLSNLHKSSGVIHLYFPIHGLELKDIDEIKMGPVNLISYTTMMARTNEKIYIYFDSIKNAKFWERTKSKMEDEILPFFVNRVCAEVETRGDFFTSIKLAENYAKSIIDVLRIYLPIIYELCDVDAIKIGIMDNDDFAMSNSFSISMNYPYNVGYSKQWRGRRFNYVLSNKNLELMRKNHLNEFLHTIIEGAASKSEFDKRIFLAAGWIGMGINEDEAQTSNKILKLAVGLECLLINEKTCITEKLAERCALVQQLDFKERIEIYKKIIYYYDARSRIVHNGLSDIDYREVRDFQSIVIKTLLSIILLKEKYQWVDFENLKSWIREQKFITPAGT